MNLYNGISVKSPLFDHILIEENDFLSNHNGVKISTQGLAHILNNNFDIPAISDLEYGNSAAQEPFGVYLIGCTGYEVEENTFIGTDRDRNVGIAIKNSGPVANEIYNNFFEELEAGIITMGENRDNSDSDFAGLQFRCNDLGTEIHPLDYSIALTLGGEIAQDQGAISVPFGGAGNTFYPDCDPVVISSEREFYVSPTTPITSTVNYAPFAQDFTRPDCKTDDLVTVLPSQDPFDKDLHCPSDLSTDIEIGVSRQKFLQNKSMLQTLKTVYNNTANGGDTQYLLNLIANAAVSSFDLRNELMMASPHITEVVLIKAIERIPSMNNWHLAQVLLANSPLPRGVINILERSDVQAYYRELVLNGQNGGMSNTSIQQMEMAYFTNLKERARRDYVQVAYATDSTMSLNDSIIHYLSDDINVHQLKTLLSYHLTRSQFQEAQDILVNASTYGWSKDYEDIMNTLIEAKQDTLGAENTILANQSMLETIAADSTLDALLAQAVLESYELVVYEHAIIFPSGSSKSLKRSKKSVSKNTFASVNPNPAKNLIYLNWNLPEGINPEKVNVSIYNIQGKQLLTDFLNQEVGILEINVSSYPSGIYIYHLQHDGTLLQSEKFEVLR